MHEPQISDLLSVSNDSQLNRLLSFGCHSHVAKQGVVVSMVIFSVVLGLTSAVHATAAVELADPSQQSSWVSHRFGDGRFLVQTPANWQQRELPNIGRGNIYVTDTQNDLHLQDYTTPKVDVNLNSLKEAIQLAVKKLSARFDQAQEVEAAMTQNGVFPSAGSSLKLSFEKLNLIYDLRILDCGDSWVELHLWAIPSQYTKNENLFNQIRESLQLANSATPVLSGDQTRQQPANRSSAPGMYEMIIWTGIGLVFLAIVVSAIQRLRKRLSADSSPTWKTYINELGGYIIVLILILLGGIAVLFDKSESQSPPAPVWNDNTF